MIYVEHSPSVATNIGFGATGLSRAKITTIAVQTNSCLIFVINNHNWQSKRSNQLYSIIVTPLLASIVVMLVTFAAIAE